MPSRTIHCEAAPVAIVAQEADGPKKFDGVAYTGGQMNIAGWYRPLVVDLAGIKTDSAAVPVYLQHDSNRIVGHGSVEVSAQRIRLSGVLSGENEVSEQVQRSAKAGFPWKLSVGIEPGKIEFVEKGSSATANGRTWQGPINIVRGGILGEVSFVPRAADSKTHVAVAAERESHVMDEQFNAWLEAKGFEADKLTTEQKAALQASYNAEQGTGDNNRVAAIRAAFNGECPELELEALRTNMSVDQAQAALRAAKLNGIRTGRGPLETVRASNVNGRGFDRETLEAGLLLRAGHEKAALSAFGERTVESASHLRRWPMRDFIKAGLHLAGIEAPANDHELVRAGFSQALVTQLLSNVANKSLLAQWNESPATWRSWCNMQPAANFKTHRSIRPSFLGQLHELPETGEIRHGHINESYFDWSVDTYAMQYRLTRKDIINDDLNGFSEIMPSLAKAAMRKLSDLVYEVLMANASAHFSSANANNIDDPLSVGALGTAVQTMRQQRDADSNDLDIVPRVLVVCPELEVTGRQILESIELNRTGDNSPTGNPLRSIVALEVEPRLSNTAKFANASATGWYVFSSPDSVPMVVGTLDGREAPTVEAFGLDADPNQLAFSWRVYHDFGAALGDHRAAVRSTGDGEAAE